MSGSRIPAAVCAVLLAGGVTIGEQPRPARKAAPRPAAERDVLPFHAVEKTLPNGLKVIVVPTGFPNIVSLQIPVQTGSRNEVEPGKSGFAHFFEHMMFRGTKAYPSEKYNEVITQAGARQNAYTTNDYTNYHTTFAKDDLETVLKIEADRFKNLDYSQEGFKTEARAVLGEYNKNSANPLVKIEEVEWQEGDAVAGACTGGGVTIFTDFAGSGSHPVSTRQHNNNAAAKRWIISVSMRASTSAMLPTRCIRPPREPSKRPRVPSISGCPACPIRITSYPSRA